MTSDQTKVLLEAHRQLMEGDAILAPILKLLDEEGYKIYRPPTDESHCYSFQKRVDDGLHFLCECNDKLFMNVTVWDFTINGHSHQSVEMYMTHENSENNWFHLKVYGIKLEEFVEYYQTGFDKLFKAWKTVY